MSTFCLFNAESLVGTYGKIMAHKDSLEFPDDVQTSKAAEDIIRQFLTDRTARLGFDGADSVKRHPFFKNEQWTFANIRHSVPPIVHEMSSDDDTRNFDEVDNEAPSENFPTPKAFAGNHLPFIGFTYSKDYQLMAAASAAADRPPPIPDRGVRSGRDSMSSTTGGGGGQGDVERLEELNNRLNKSSKELADANQREDEMRSELGRKEKDLALVRHEVKEMQRKAEVDLDLRKKAEAERAEIRKRLEDETNKRTREQNNNHHVAEKIANLEKEKRELSEKLKREMENAEKMKKNNNDASVAKVN